MGTTTTVFSTIWAINYTIPRNKWELQLSNEEIAAGIYYTIPRNKWELQRVSGNFKITDNYTIPRNKWELQLLIANTKWVGRLYHTKK